MFAPLPQTRLLPHLLPAFLSLCVVMLAEPSLACGGGGSTSYRKPPRPGHQHQSTARQPLPQGSIAERELPETSPAR